MIIQLHINDEEMKSWLTRAGFDAEMREVTVFNSAYHNRIEERTHQRLHVRTSEGKWMPAENFAAKYLKQVVFNQ